MAIRSRFILMMLIGLVTPLPALGDLQKAQDDLAVTSNNNSVLVDVLANDGELGPGLRILKAFKPGHGTVSIENGRIRYTPSPGFEGSDSFRYMAQADKSQPGQATVNVDVGEGGVALRLVGQVVDSPIADAIIKVSVGGFDFAAVADANGRYSIDIASLTGDAFVTLTATGTSATGAAVRFYSLVGEMARLDTAAGSDGILVRDENNQVNITNLSTAQYTLITQANGGEPVRRDQEFQPLVQNINLDELLKLAAIIKLVVDGGVALPAGVTDALDLISSPSALNAFEASLAPNQLAEAVVAVSQDPSVTPDFRAGALPRGYALIAPSAPGTIHQGDNAGALLTLVDSASATSGVATFYHSDPDTGANQTWSLDSGDILLIQDNPVQGPFFSTNVINPSCGLFAVLRLRETPVSVRVRRLQDGAGVDYLELITTTHREYDVDQNTGDTCVPPPDGVDTYPPYRVLGFEDGSGELPFLATESLGRMVLTHDQLLGGFFGNAAVFNFDTHTVDIAGTQPSFTSSISNGRLQVQLTNNGGQVSNYEFRRYQVDGRKGAALMSFVITPAGRKVSRFMLTARVDDTLVFDYDNLPAHWLTGAFLSRLQVVVPGGFLAINGDAALTGFQRSINTNGAITDTFPFTWGIESGQMVARTYRVPTNVNVSFCSPSGLPGCFVTRIRTWQPIARDGDRIYVLEELLNTGSSSVLLRVTASRMAYFEPE